MNIGEKISQIRKMSGMTQEQLAEKMNVSRQTISKWEKGFSAPDLESAVTLCKLFRISLDDFMKGEEKVEKEEKLSLQDMIKINRRTQRMTILLLSGLFFLMIGILAGLFITALESTTTSMQYMLYRYIVTGQYESAPVDYWRLACPVILLVVIGIVLCTSYIRERWREKKGNEK